MKVVKVLRERYHARQKITNSELMALDSVTEKCTLNKKLLNHVTPNR